MRRMKGKLAALYMAKKYLDRNPALKARLKNAGLRLIGRGRAPGRTPGRVTPPQNPPQRPYSY